LLPELNFAGSAAYWWDKQTMINEKKNHHSGYAAAKLEGNF